MEHSYGFQELKRLFPGKRESMRFIGRLRWGTSPHCPYCGSRRISPFRNEDRYHCNACNISFSATVNTIFHNTRIPLQKWFRALLLFRVSRRPLSVRRLAAEIGVNKNTACNMLSRMRTVFRDIGVFPDNTADGRRPSRDREGKLEGQIIEILQSLLRRLLEFS
jgi:transposase-like protein